jgi:hypothetical protein
MLTESAWKSSRDTDYKKYTYELPAEVWKDRTGKEKEGKGREGKDMHQPPLHQPRPPMPIKPGACNTDKSIYQHREKHKKLYGFVSVAGTDDRQAGMQGRNYGCSLACAKWSQHGGEMKAQVHTRAMVGENWQFASYRWRTGGVWEITTCRSSRPQGN